MYLLLWPSLGLSLGLEAPEMTPNDVIFLSFFFCSGCLIPAPAMLAGPQLAALASSLQEALLTLAVEIEQGRMTIMLVPRAALVETCAAGAQLQIWGAIADKQVQGSSCLCAVAASGSN